MNERTERARIWTRAALLILVVIVLLVLLLLNMNAVIDPRLHLIVMQFERPNVLAVMLITVLLSAVAGLLTRTVYTAVRELRESRERSASSLPPHGHGPAGSGAL